VADTEAGAGWRPILGETERETVLAAIDGFAQGLPSDSRAGSDGSLSRGSAGVSLFFAYRAEAVGGNADAETAVALAERTLEDAAARPRDLALYGGFVGVGWTLAHLERLFLNLGDEDPNDALDEALLSMFESPWAGEYDLIGGLVGIGVYALERLPRPTARGVLERVVERLEQIAERDLGAARWHRSPELLPAARRPEYPRGYYDLGVAHGVPGVIALLGHAVAHGVESARPLLEDAVGWLLAQRLPPDRGSSFPYRVGPGVATRPSRLAWCYGEPGIAAALLVAARAASEPEWERESLAVALASLERPLEQSGVADSGLCHGAAGLGHLYNRLYQLTGEERLRAGARFWFGRALAFDRPAEPGFLEGEAGVGLALLAAATDIEPAWDAVLLLSTPPS